MGNKTGKMRSFGRNSPGGSSRREIISHSLSNDSIISNTTSQQCLLIDSSYNNRDKTHCIRNGDTLLLQSSVEEINERDSPLSSDDTLINDTTSIDNIKEDNNKFIITEKRHDAVECEPHPLVMPERIVRKLSPKEWNELVQIFSHSLEQSLKSTLPSNINTTTTNTVDCPIVTTAQETINSTCQTSTCTSSRPTETTLSLEEVKERSATINCPPTKSTVIKRHRHSGHHHHTKRRPLSLPPNETIMTTTSTERENRRKHYVLPTTHTKTTDKNNDKKRHKRKHCTSTSSSDKYITLAQLKELGLAFKTSDGLILGGGSPRISPRQTVMMTHSMEQLCYLGPTQRDDNSSAISNMAVADYDMCSASSTPTSSYIKEHRYVHLHSTTSIKIENSYLLSTTEQ